MSSTPHSLIDISLRSYAQQRAPNRHDYVQLVLPMHGQLLLEIEGRTGRVDTQQGVVITPGAWHGQHSSVANSSIILDVAHSTVLAGNWQRLLDLSYMPIGQGARKLIEYMALMAQQQRLTPALVQGWTPLLLDTLVLDEAQPKSRLSAMLVRVQADPGQPWSTDTMARCANLSVSRLHALFRAELQTTPHAWLLQQRMARACELLAASNATLAQIALATGFSDQSALTRAMRDNIDMTPSAYRRQGRESRSKVQ